LTVSCQRRSQKVFEVMALSHVGSLIFLVATLIGQIHSQTCQEAAKCEVSECKLPDCFCSGNETELDQQELDQGHKKPQIVYLTFDDALSNLASTQFYEELFGTPTNHTYSNPNGCALRATHFITHSYTDYSLVNKWWHYGHEIASHSVTHRNDLKYWEGMTEEEFKAEAVGQRRITGQFAALDPCEIKGWRSPFLQGSADTMYGVLEQENFDYDCTWPTRRFGYVDAEQGLYPYTMDYRSVQDCPIEPCPQCSHPGLWVQPMIDLEDEWIGANPNTPHSGNPCSMLDACTIMQRDNYTVEDPDQVYHMLMKNFKRVYEGDEDFDGQLVPGNRAPWGLYMHAAWFFGDYGWHYTGYKKFIQEIASYDDVWIVPVESGLEYMRSLFFGANLSNEQLIAQGKDNGPFACADIENQTGKYEKTRNRCGPAKSCRFPNVTQPADNIFNQERYMTICSYNSEGTRQNCPNEDTYPWLETDNVNPCGGNIPCKDAVNCKL